jgi:integrase/recombinase XerD
MSELRRALNDYLGVRRALGFKLKNEGRLLHDFVTFAEGQQASVITRDLALRWATAPLHVQAARWTRRLDAVRGFAKYRAGTDPRTDVPPRGLLPHRYRRVSPYVCPLRCKRASVLPLYRTAGSWAGTR